MAFEPYCVIGSGPAGIASASALLQQGAHVLMIDAGLQCENEKLFLVRNLAAQEPEQWDPTAVKAIRSSYLQARGGHAFKPAYGSEFAYAKDELSRITQQGTKCLLSHAMGGFSNVWGAAVLPAPAQNFEDWPFNIEQLEPSYAEAAKTLGISGIEDGLTSLFPLYAKLRAPLKPSRQARMLLRRWNKSRESLASSGIIFGRSRLAAQARDDEARHYCRLTGLCLTGCPYSAIYNSQQTLAELQKSPRFRYEPGWIAQNIEETADGVFIQCRAVSQGAKARFEAKRVFLACGALGTAKLILASLDSTAVSKTRLTLRYQPYFLLPLLALFRCRGTAEERLHTLAQAFVEITDPKISRSPIHIQFYTYNDFMKERVLHMLRFAPEAVRRRLGPAFWERLLAIQGYFHSGEAAAIAMRAEKSPDGEVKMALAGRLPLRTKWKITRVALKLARKAREIGGLPLLPFLEFGLPGEGNHIGSIFPMAKEPAGLQSDIWGRVKGFKRTHAVDASVLPSLPAATITYTVMANADRIARRMAEEDAAP